MGGERSFTKAERIVSQKLIDDLFSGGSSHSMAAFPLRVVYMRCQSSEPTAPPVQILVSVPKKRFRHAVDRNRVKRQVREAYRRKKQVLIDNIPPGQQLAVAFIWLSDTLSTSAEVDGRVGALLKRIVKRLKEPSDMPPPSGNNPPVSPAP